MTSRALTLKTPEGALPFTLTHRPRITRRLHLELDDDGGLVVVVPRDWPDFYTRRLLRQNLAYVRRFLARARHHRPEPLHFVDGSRHLFGGEPITLRVVRTPGRSRRPALHGDTLTLALAQDDPERVRRALRAWYLEQARARFAERLARQQQRAPWARSRDLELRLRRMKRTWGTCNRHGLIRLNTHLIKAPLSCLDYVICHELCHLEEMNHGPAFYALQEKLWPAWRETRAHLRRHGGRYTQE